MSDKSIPAVRFDQHGFFHVDDPALVGQVAGGAAPVLPNVSCPDAPGSNLYCPNVGCPDTNTVCISGTNVACGTPTNVHCPRSNYTC